MTRSATVCVSTYNRAGRVERLLEALLAQDVTDFDVVVFDDASTDRTREVLGRWVDHQKLPLTVLTGQQNAGPARGRNAAWQAATGALILFTDDDCVPDPSWVREHLAVQGSRRVTVGRTEPDPGQPSGPFSRSVRVSDASYFQTCNVSYPRRLVEELGGFDETFRRAAGEDTELGLRAVEAGAEPVFAPAALVLHEVRPSSWRAALREAVKWADLPLVVAKHPKSSRSLLYSRLWWRRSHPVAALAALGLVVGMRRPAALLAVLPWLRFRTTEQLPQARRRTWPVVLPAQLVLDVVEVGTLARGSVRHRRLLL